MSQTLICNIPLDSGEARNLQVGGHVTIFQFFGWAQTQKFEDLP
jgi:hypothetical protein